MYLLAEAGRYTKRANLINLSQEAFSLLHINSQPYVERESTLFLALSLHLLNQVR